MLLVLDLDGTLLNSSKEINPIDNDFLFSNKDSFDLILASGRHYFEIEKTLSTLKLKPKYVICCDGAKIYNQNGSELIFQNGPYFLNINEIKTILKIAKKGEILLIEDKRTFVYRENFTNRIKRIVTRTRLPRFSFLNNSSIEKIRLIKRNISQKSYDELTKLFSVHIVFDKYLDVKKKGVSKYAAIQALCKMEDISEDEVLYFGDDMNDIECFDNFKHCVAMGNACDIIREKSEFITKTNDECGVSWGLDMYIRGNGKIC